MAGSHGHEEGNVLVNHAKGHWYVKEYYGDLGCVEEKAAPLPNNDSSKFWLSKWIQNRLEEIPFKCKHDVSYRMFDPEGSEIMVDINWKPEIHLHNI